MRLGPAPTSSRKRCPPSRGRSRAASRKWSRPHSPGHTDELPGPVWIRRPSPGSRPGQASRVRCVRGGGRKASEPHRGGFLLGDRLRDRREAERNTLGREQRVAERGGAFEERGALRAEARQTGVGVPAPRRAADVHQRPEIRVEEARDLAAGGQQRRGLRHLRIRSRREGIAGERSVARRRELSLPEPHERRLVVPIAREGLGDDVFDDLHDKPRRLLQGPNGGGARLHVAQDAPARLVVAGGGQRHVELGEDPEDSAMRPCSTKRIIGPNAALARSWLSWPRARSAPPTCRQTSRSSPSSGESLRARRPLISTDSCRSTNGRTRRSAR